MVHRSKRSFTLVAFVGLTQSENGLLLLSLLAAFRDPSSFTSHCCSCVGTSIIITGASATLLAYGGTDSGKSYSLFGFPSGIDEGIVPRACRDLFRRIGEEAKKEKEVVSNYCDRSESQEEGDEGSGKQRDNAEQQQQQQQQQQRENAGGKATTSFRVGISVLEFFWERARDLLKVPAAGGEAGPTAGGGEAKETKSTDASSTTSPTLDATGGDEESIKTNRASVAAAGFRPAAQVLSETRPTPVDTAEEMERWLAYALGRQSAASNVLDRASMHTVVQLTVTRITSTAKVASSAAAAATAGTAPSGAVVASSTGGNGDGSEDDYEEISTQLRLVELAGSETLLQPDSSLPDLDSASLVDQSLRELVRFIAAEAQNSDAGGGAGSSGNGVASWVPLASPVLRYAFGLGPINGNGGSSSSSSSSSSNSMSADSSFVGSSINRSSDLGRRYQGHITFLGTVSPLLLDAAATRATLEVASCARRVTLHVSAAVDNLKESFISIERGRARLSADAAALGVAIVGATDKAAESGTAATAAVAATGEAGAGGSGAGEGAPRGSSSSSSSAFASSFDGGGGSGEMKQNTTLQAQHLQLTTQRQELMDRRRKRAAASARKWTQDRDAAKAALVQAGLHLPDATLGAEQETSTSNIGSSSSSSSSRSSSAGVGAGVPFLLALDRDSTKAAWRRGIPLVPGLTAIGFNPEQRAAEVTPYGTTQPPPDSYLHLAGPGIEAVHCLVMAPTPVRAATLRGGGSGASRLRTRVNGKTLATTGDGVKLQVGDRLVLGSGAGNVYMYFPRRRVKRTPLAALRQRAIAEAVAEPLEALAAQFSGQEERILGRIPGGMTTMLGDGDFSGSRLGSGEFASVRRRSLSSLSSGGGDDKEGGASGGGDGSGGDGGGVDGSSGSLGSFGLGSGGIGAAADPNKVAGYRQGEWNGALKMQLAAAILDAEEASRIASTLKKRVRYSVKIVQGSAGAASGTPLGDGSGGGGGGSGGGGSLTQGSSNAKVASSSLGGGTAPATAVQGRAAPLALPRFPNRIFVRCDPAAPSSTGVAAVAGEPGYRMDFDFSFRHRMLHIREHFYQALPPLVAKPAQNTSKPSPWSQDDDTPVPRDPFEVGEPRVLGTAVLSLECLLYLLDIDEATAIIDFRGHPLGDLHVQLAPYKDAACSQRFNVETGFHDRISHWLGKVIYVSLSIQHASGLSNKLASTLVRYQLYGEQHHRTTRRIRGAFGPDAIHHE